MQVASLALSPSLSASSGYYCCRAVYIFQKKELENKEDAHISK
jgi:hypothetical protein